MSERITFPVIRIKGTVKLYLGNSHPACVDFAVQDNALTVLQAADFNYEKDGLFLTSENRVLTRDQAYAEFGIRKSNEIPYQRTKE